MSYCDIILFRKKRIEQQMIQSRNTSKILMTLDLNGALTRLYTTHLASGIGYVAQC